MIALFPIMAALNMIINKAWAAIEKLLIQWKPHLSDRIKREFLQVVLLYGRTAWILTNILKKKAKLELHKMLCAFLNKFWTHLPIKQKNKRAMVSTGRWRMCVAGICSLTFGFDNIPLSIRIVMQAIDCWVWLRRLALFTVYISVCNRNFSLLFLL